MSDAAPFLQVEIAELRRLLHAVNGELSVAMLGLELLLERGGLDRAGEAAVVESLDACRRATVIQRDVWAMLDGHGARSESQRR